MANSYSNELEFITNTIKDAYASCTDTISVKFSGADSDTIFESDSFCMDKSSFDIVTTLDFNIEKFIIEKIHKTYPDDMILSEETMPDTTINNEKSEAKSENLPSVRTWTIDPIDGTFNMAAGMPLYGVQCSMFENSETVIAAIYLPILNEIYTAAKDGGAYLNGNKIHTHFTSLDKSIVSFGDFPHSRPDDISDERIIMNELYNHIARVRMFGAASIDFAYLASGKTQGTVIFTRNKWDISPGILLCKEAGAIVVGDNGDYTPESRYVIAVADKQLVTVLPAI